MKMENVYKNNNKNEGLPNYTDMRLLNSNSSHKYVNGFVA